jgi:hypothetical protein
MKNYFTVYHQYLPQSRNDFIKVSANRIVEYIEKECLPFRNGPIVISIESGYIRAGGRHFGAFNVKDCFDQLVEIYTTDKREGVNVTFDGTTLTISLEESVKSPSERWDVVANFGFKPDAARVMDLPQDTVDVSLITTYTSSGSLRMNGSGEVFTKEDGSKFTIVNLKDFPQEPFGTWILTVSAKRKGL